MGKKLSIRQQVAVVLLLLIAVALSGSCGVQRKMYLAEKSTFANTVLDSALMANSLPALPVWRASVLQYRNGQTNPYYVWIQGDEKEDHYYTVELTDSVYHFTHRVVCSD